ncbi:SDR family NAD(P)-dependent oxidoreductase [Microbacterium sp. A196]|uniref:SDR family NAD(P)-dependent oxidoreductase n=1 Tax=unclassified Microbacterium TaxID=2609290 RepID=UPI003FD2325F
MAGNRLENKVAIVTGGGSGLGLASAKLFVAEGARAVIIVDLDSPKARDAAVGIGAEFIPVDVSDAAAMDALVQGVFDKYGRLDVMFNNAGISLLKPILETEDSDFQRLVDVNFRGVFNGVRAAGRAMVKQGSGSIISTASNGGSSATAGQAVYCATKFAVIGMSKAAAIELAPSGVRVNTLSPGTMLSGMVPDDPELHARLHKLQPVGYAADPVLMAHGAVFLASDEAEYVTGHDLIIDGGATAGRAGM